MPSFIPQPERLRATQDLLVLMYNAEVSKGVLVDESMLNAMKRALTKWELKVLTHAKQHQHLNLYWEQHQLRRQEIIHYQSSHQLNTTTATSSSSSPGDQFGAVDLYSFPSNASSRNGFYPEEEEEGDYSFYAPSHQRRWEAADYMDEDEYGGSNGLDDANDFLYRFHAPPIRDCDLVDDMEAIFYLSDDGFQQQVSPPPPSSAAAIGSQ